MHVNLECIFSSMISKNFISCQQLFISCQSLPSEPPKQNVFVYLIQKKLTLYKKNMLLTCWQWKAWKRNNYDKQKHYIVDPGSRQGEGANVKTEVKMLKMVPGIWSRIDPKKILLYAKKMNCWHIDKHIPISSPLQGFMCVKNEPLTVDKHPTIFSLL